ncbi:efflux RND transporter periplasmic adaptor subunit [Marinomonas pollencensis]|uniref:RND family efflux transporter MFP subunit n=1 Tax=Marinomonas pollencensis TaxID=491954 RepID=A0A3E0DC33_9GAMM|nr:efflux RND transporter periplasmic adaptor subunit [Marinomonas pollencensis]REG79532.1 RND family efflux transporter MFP subunit [Marinomonas pollencensis]
MKRFKRKQYGPLAILGLSLLLTACSSDNEDANLAKEVVRPVKLITIGSTEAINIRRFPGELKASQDADLALRVGGQLIKLNVVDGQRVKKGELLAELDPTDFKLEVELAQANQDLAKAQFDRTQIMLKRNATSKSQFDEAKATLAQADNALESAKNQLKYTKLYAPFDGVISSTSTENFQYVSATQTLMHIQDLDNLEVEFQVPESLVVSIKSAQNHYQPKVLVDVAPDAVYQGAYKEHKTMPDQSTMAYDVTLSLIREGAKQHTLLPGMTANVDMDLSKLLGVTKHIVVPVEAVVQTEDPNTGEAQSTVWVYQADNQTVTKKAVELGALKGSMIEIRSGLEPGEQIVAAGVDGLTAAMKVRPWTRERGL